MYYACTIDPLSGHLITADECETQQEAQLFIEEELAADPQYSLYTFTILNRDEVRARKERF